MDDFRDWAHNDPLGFLLLLVLAAVATYLIVRYVGLYIIEKMP